MNPHVLVFGANGQLGKRLVSELSAMGYEVTALDRTACDFSHIDRKKIEVILRAVEPCCIVNAAAYTAVDAAEHEPALAFRVNAEIATEIARVAELLGIPVVHFSTDYVFDGTCGAPYPETALTHPLNMYGRSKREGETGVLGAGGYVFRLQWVYDGSGSNFYTTMIRLLSERTELQVVADQIGAPTPAAWIAEAIGRMLPRLLTHAIPAGLYHLTAGGSTSWHGFACAIAAQQASHRRILPVTSAEYRQMATRPCDTRLDCSALARYGICLPHWREALK